MSTQPVHHYTSEQYLEMERDAECRHEYLDGSIVAMSGGTMRHALIAGAVFASFHNQLPRGNRCRVVASDLRVFIAAHNIYTYPDVVVMCGPPCFQGERSDTINDVTVIAEVLSPTTKNYGCGEKFRFYRSLASFCEYLLIAQDAVRVEHHVLQKDRSWVFREYSSREDRIELESIGCHLSLEAVYDRAEIESPAL